MCIRDRRGDLREAAGRADHRRADGHQAARADRRAVDRARLYGASQPGSFTEITTLGALAELAAVGALEAPTELPGVLVVGEVVSLADVIGHVQSAPLAERSL